ncbi:hypothetical protein HMI54_004410 [Coelomomyces lativittatus]|nr:hypothetical protein HMI54_004410 [Coelomomyces lativittatus]
MNSFHLEDKRNRGNESIDNDVDPDKLNEEKYFLTNNPFQLNRKYAIVNKISLDGTKIVPPSKFPMIKLDIESPTWRFLVETKDENQEFIFPCKLTFNCIDKKKFNGFGSYNCYIILIPINQYDHNKYIQVNFVKSAISDMQELGEKIALMSVYCNSREKKYFSLNIPTVIIEYNKVKSSIPTISNEEYEKWKNIPENKLIDTPPESYDFSEFIAIPYAQRGKIFAGKRYKKCKTLEEISYFTVGVVYNEEYNYYDRSLSEDEVERQMLLSCGTNEVIYYQELKSIKKWEIIPEDKLLNTPPESYEYSKYLYVFNHAHIRKVKCLFQDTSEA